MIIVLCVSWSTALGDDGLQLSQQSSSVDHSPASHDSSVMKDAKDGDQRTNTGIEEISGVPGGNASLPGGVANTLGTGYVGGGRVRNYSSSDVLDAAFSEKWACASPGLDRMADVDRRKSFCWFSPCHGHCTLSGEGTGRGPRTVGEKESKDADVGTGDDGLDALRKPDVQQITKTVLEVLPESQKANFALSKEGAKVLASNPGAKRVGALLDDDSDTFMRNDCKDNKWVVIELSQVARVSSVEISQHELYSSRVKEFTVYGMQSHPRMLAMESSNSVDSNGWSFIGTFTAAKTKGTQEFQVQHPRWVRYLLVRFLTHHGSESVCAINELGVYGTSAAEELEAQLAQDEFMFDSETNVQGGMDTPSVDLNGTEASGVGSDQVEVVSRAEKTSDISNRTDVVEDSTRDGGKDSTGVDHAVTGPIIVSGRNDTETGDSGEMCLVTYRMSSYDGHNSSIVIGSSGIEINASNGRSKGDGPSLALAVDQHEYIPVPKPKQGGTVYDILVQELRSTKAQQKMVGKTLESLHKNLESVVEELTQMKKVSGIDSATEFQRKLSFFEDQLEHLKKASISQTRAAVSLLSAVLGSLTLQMDLFKSHSSVLMLLARSLVVSNAIAGAILILKGAMISAM